MKTLFWFLSIEGVPTVLVADVGEGLLMELANFQHSHIKEIHKIYGKKELFLAMLTAQWF